MDDVPMFITRKLYPPPEVDIPEDLVQIFNKDSNELSSDSQSYDFTLENYVCTKISEWVRNTEIEKMNRDERIRVRELEKARENEERHKQLLTAVQYDDLSSGEDEDIPEPAEIKTVLQPQSHINFDTILQPTIVPSQVNNSSPATSCSKLLNYSDFETIESSPFDNVELKTINDLDILAQVLQSTTVHSTTSNSPEEVVEPPPNPEPKSIEITKEPEEKVVPNVVNNQPVFPPYYSPNINGNHKPTAQNVHLIPDILKGLKNEIQQSETRRSQSNEREPLVVTFPPKAEVKSNDEEKPKQYNLEQHFTSLSPKSQSLINSICQMGFPMERVINVVGKLGEKEKEIVDHLIPLSELLDLGFEEQKISDALLKFDNNKEKALDFLIS